MHEKLIAELEELTSSLRYDAAAVAGNAAAALREDAGAIAELRAKLAACEADKKLLYNAIKKHKDELYELYSKPTVPEHIPMAEVLNIELHGAIAALKEGK